MRMLGVIDYNAGNIKSVSNCLEKLNIPFFISGDPHELETAEKILFPGVGHAKASMIEVKKRGLDIFLKNTNKPVLGICVGMQLMFDWAEEGDTKCLGIIEGKVPKFCINEVGIVPHIGWNEVEFSRRVLGIKDNTDFYFVHSYYCQPKNQENILAETSYNGKKFCCAVEYKNYMGMQFHPEKSGKYGEEVLKKFWEI